MRVMHLAIAIVVAATAVACNSNPYCLNCGAREGGVSDGGGEILDFTIVQGPDLAGDAGGSGSGDGMCVRTNNGVEICDGQDNDCNGVTDDVDPKTLVADPNNCGKCGQKCSYANAQGKCGGGMCSKGDCLPGFYDINKNPADGCEYQCFPSNNGMEICDGKDNNCNGVVDEGFDLLHDVNNCGDCGFKCAQDQTCSAMSIPGGPDGGVTMVGTCHLTCPACKADIDGNAANGCEYACPVCPPTKEQCNGIDDDCNGLVDDNVVDVGQPCDQACPALAPCVGQANCAYQLAKCVGKCCGVCTQGATICAGGQKVCQAGAGPKLEVCNGMDDNCDGQVDEGFDLQTDPVNCGVCGKACAAANAVAGCAKGACTILSCKPGFSDVNKDPKDGCEYQCPVNPPTVEVCNGKDDDCNGVADDSPAPAPKNFCNQSSICMGTTATCQGAMGYVCQYQKNNPHIEVDMNGNLAFVESLCDGFDGNCNGMVDESFVNKGKACAAGVGACQGAGMFSCSMDMMGTTCSAVANAMAASDEVCNGIDDNCDGNVDERAPANGTMCFNGGQHACKALVPAMVKTAGGTYIDPYEASRPDATANGVGVGTNRACAKPGVLPWAPVTYAQAAAACAAITDSAGKAMRLCDAAEWTAACNNANMTNPIWSYAQSPTVYAGNTCNGFDAGVGKAAATGSFQSCYTPLGGGKVYDLSGNVGEWTRTSVTTNGKTYYKVRGGAYNNFAVGINCDFDFTIELPSYQFNDLGFRCCADNPP